MILTDREISIALDMLAAGPPKLGHYPNAVP